MGCCPSERWILACFVVLLLGVEMRATNPIQAACHKATPLEPNANVYDLGLKQDESSRLRRIRDLKHENALLMRIVSETQIEIARLRELLSAE